MSPALAIVLFIALVAALAVLVMLESRRRRRGPRTSPEAFRSQLGATRIPYAPPPEKRARSMVRK
jgi:hypothetical protein